MRRSEFRVKLVDFVDFTDDFFFVFGFCPWVDMEVNCLLNLLASEYSLVWALLFQDCIPLASLGQQEERASAAAHHKQQQQERDHTNTALMILPHLD